MTKLHFKTTAAANLFASEITGQISDGAWENARPLDHWKFWCNAEVVVDGKVGHEGNPAKTNYNLNSLKKYIKEEMKNAIRITKMPWFDMSFSEMSRTLTDTVYLKFSPSCLDTRTPMTKEQIVKQYECLIKSRAEKALKEIGDNCTDEFKKMIEDEVINQMVINEEQHAKRYNEYAAKNWEKLKEIGITDIDSYHKMIETISAVEVTDAELNAVLAEITDMLRTAC